MRGPGLGNTFPKLAEPHFLWSPAAQKVRVGSPRPRGRQHPLRSPAPWPYLLHQPQRSACCPLRWRNCPCPGWVRGSLPLSSCEVTLSAPLPSPPLLGPLQSVSQAAQAEEVNTTGHLLYNLALDLKPLIRFLT